MTSHISSVLLVDDDTDTCNIFQMVMDHHNIHLTIARDAVAAFEILKRATPDVIVLDLFLPGTDGYQIFNQIRQKSLAPEATFVATTAYHTSSTHDDVMERGFQGYLPKPLNSSGIVSYLEDTIQKK